MPPGFVYEVFFDIAGKHPEWTAIQSGEISLTYGQLDRRALSIAALLTKAGVRRGSRVVVFADDRLCVIESILGILCCGAVFVPLSPSVPSKRLEWMLKECDPEFALVEPGLSETFRTAFYHLRLPIVIEPSSGDEAPDSLRGQHPRERSEGDDLSYLVFTSGSTGRPKAIAGRLKAIDHFVRWEIETFGIGPGCRISQLFSPMFDAFLRDVFAPLCAGGAICIPPNPDTVLDGSRLAAWLQRERITHMHTVPSVLRILLDRAGERGHLPNLKYVLVAGEPLLPSDVKKWLALSETTGGQLVNLYGPSETTMTKFVYSVNENDQAKRIVPIGKPIPGAKAVVVDDAGKVCPAGTVGEIYIRTPYRSLGYFRQPEMTGEVFIRNPFSNAPDDIVYKTGDLARVLDDGNFELVGRRDYQVKIRGVRIELGEIEAAIGKCDGIRQSVVVARESGLDTQLIAYMVMQNGSATVDVNELRRSLGAWLPMQSIPAAFIILEELPLLASGKVDRKRLSGAATFESGSRGPRDGEEEILCGIFAEILNRESVGIDDNFFGIGGHSLLAAQVVSRIRGTFNVELPLRALFDSPTVAQIGGRIRLARGEAQFATAPIPRAPSGHDFTPSYAQHRLWFVSQLEPESAAYNLAFGLRTKGRLDRGAFRWAVREIVRRHDVFRMSFPAQNGNPVVHIDSNIDLPIDEIDLCALTREVREAEVSRLASDSAERPFDLARSPLLRIRLIRLNDLEHVLCVTVHHIIFDAWSAAVFVRELTILYESFVQNNPSPLAQLPLQYADTAVWERQWLRDEVLNRHLDYWRARLEGCSHSLDLPTDFPRPFVQSFRGEAEVLALPSEVVRKLTSLGRCAASTQFMVLLAVMNIWLHSYTGQNDILVGTPISNRNRLETEGMIGLFVNTLVFRAEIKAEVPFLEFLSTIRSSALDAYAHQSLPFERLIDELRIPRDASRNPLFQVMLNIENAPPPVVRLQGLDVEGLGTSFVRSRFDLHMGVRPKPDGLELVLIYNSDLFRSETARSMLAGFGELAGYVADAPHAGIGELAERLKRFEQQQAILSKRNRSQQQIQRLRTTHRFPVMAGTPN